MNKEFTFFKIVSLEIPVGFLHAKAPLKLLYCCGMSLYLCISFNVLILETYFKFRKQEKVIHH